MNNKNRYTISSYKPVGYMYKLFRKLIPKAALFESITLILILPDYQKSIGSFNRKKLLKALAEYCIDRRYTYTLKYIKDDLCSITLHEDTNKFHKEIGVRRGGIVSSNLFITFIEYIFEQVTGNKYWTTSELLVTSNFRMR